MFFCRNTFSYPFIFIFNSLLISHIIGRTPDYIEDLPGIQDYDNFKNVGEFFSLGPAHYTTAINADVQNLNNSEKQGDYDYAGYAKQPLRKGSSEEYNKDYYENVEIPKNASKSKDEKLLDEATENVTISNVILANNNNVNSRTAADDDNDVVNELRASVGPKRYPEQLGIKPYQNYPSHYGKNSNSFLGNSAAFSKYPIQSNRQIQGQGRYRNHYNFKGNNYRGAFGVRQGRHNVGNMYNQANNYQRPRQALNHGFYKPIIPNNNRNTHDSTGAFYPNQNLENSFIDARNKPRQYGVLNSPRPGRGRGPYVHKEVPVNGQMRQNYSKHIKDIIKEIDNNPFFIGGIGEMTYVRENGLNHGKITRSIKDVKHSMLLEALTNMSKADLGETAMNSGKIGNQRLSGQPLHGIRPQSTIPQKYEHQIQSQVAVQMQNIRAQNQDPNNQMQNFNYPNQNNLKLPKNSATQNQNPNTQAKNPTESQNQNHSLLNAETNSQYPLKQNPESYIQAPVSKNPQFENLNRSTQNQSVIPQNSEAQNQYPNSQNSASNLQIPQQPGSINFNLSQQQNQSLIPHNTAAQNKNDSSQNVPSSPQYPSKQSSDPNQELIFRNPPAQIQSPQNNSVNPQNQNIDTQNSPPKPQYPSEQKPNTDSQAPVPQNSEKPNQNLSPQNQSIPSQNSQVQDENINPENSLPNPQYPSEEKLNANQPPQQSLNPQNQSISAQNVDSQNQHLTSQPPPLNHRNAEVQDQNLNIQNRTPVQETPETQNQKPNQQEVQTAETTRKFDPSIVDYNAYDDIPGWFDGEFPALTEKTTIKTTANATNTSALAATNATGENLTSTTELSVLRPDVVSDTKKAMVTHRMGYFTGFFYELCNILKSQSGDDFDFIISIKEVVIKLEAEGKLKEFGHPALPALHNAVTILVGLGPVEIRQELELAPLMIRERRQVLSQDILSLVNTMDTSYTFVEGENLLKTLDDVFDYTHPSFANKSLSAFDVAESVVNGILQPYYRMQGSPVLSRLIQKLNSIIINKYKFDARFRVTDNLKLIDKKHRSHYTDKNRIFYDKSHKFNTHDTDSETNLIYQKEAITVRGPKTNAFKKRLINDGNFSKKQTGDKVNTAAWMSENKMYKKNKNKSHRVRTFNDTLTYYTQHGRKYHDDKITDSKTQDSSNKIEVLSGSYETYEPIKDANKYRDGMMLSTETQNKLPTDEERVENSDTDSLKKPASVPNGRKIKHYKQKINGDSILVQKHTKIYQDNNRYRIRTTRKLEIQRGKYDRLKQNEYNYEKALRHKQWNYKSYEVVTSKVSNEKDIQTKPISGKITTKKVSNIKSNINEHKSNAVSNYESFDETSENKDEMFDKEVLNNKVNFIAIQKVDQHKDKYRRHLTSVNDNVLKSKENETIKGDIKTVLEESSYSDEENQLKVILSDAIRHSDFVINNYRKYLKNRETNKRNKRIDERSSYSDEEGIFKNNIYKAFGYNPDLDLKENERKVF